MNARSRFLGVVVAGVAVAACRIGPRPENFRPAMEAAGVSATVTTASQTVIAELLEVQDSALVLLGTELLLVPERLINRATFSDTRLQIYKGFPLRPNERAQLRLLSRYPYGIPSGVLPKLLDNRGQAAIVVIEK
ncbi:MAG: hypothetical protein V4617_11920 [Gemmatimonadota bacterium]